MHAISSSETLARLDAIEPETLANERSGPLFDIHSVLIGCMRLTPSRAKLASSAAMPPLAHHCADVINHTRDSLVKDMRFFLIAQIITPH